MHGHSTKVLHAPGCPPDCKDSLKISGRNFDLDRHMGYCFDTVMTWRPVSCLAVSTLLHLGALMIFLAAMAFPFHSPRPGEEAFGVNLVGADALGKGSTQEAVQSPQPEQQREQAAGDGPEEEPVTGDQAEGGVSFETDRRVSASYLERLKTKIFLAWDYPEEAIQDGRQGIVRVMFLLNPNGELADIRVLKGSGSKSLDAASLDAIRQASPFGALPEDIRDKPLRITGKFCYVLD